MRKKKFGIAGLLLLLLLLAACGKRSIGKMAGAVRLGPAVSAGGKL